METNRVLRVASTIAGPCKWCEAGTVRLKGACPKRHKMFEKDEAGLAICGVCDEIELPLRPDKPLIR